MTEPRIKLVRGLQVGRLVLCFPLGKHPKRGRIWICKCSCGNYTKRVTAALHNALYNNNESMCDECVRENRIANGIASFKKMQEYQHNQPRLKDIFKKRWEACHDLYGNNFDQRETNILMREFVENFGPVREWELGNKNFSLDHIYENEVKNIMIVKYCDICGTKLGENVPDKNYFDGQIREFSFPATKKRPQTVVRVELSVDAPASCSEICSECIRKVVMEGKEINLEE